MPEPVSTPNSVSDMSTEKGSTEIEPVQANVNNEHEVLDGGYGWVVVFATFLITFSSWGVNSAYGVYFTYYINSDHFKGATLIQLSAVGGVSIGLGVAFAPIINYIQGKIGTQGTMMIGNLFQFSASILASFAVSYWQVLLTQGVLQSFGLAFMSLPALTLISQWFVKKRVLANSIGMTGSAVGGVVFNVGLQRIIEVKDVHWALRAQGIISFVLAFAAILLVRTKSKSLKVEFTFFDIDVLKCSGFLFFSFYSITVIFGYVIVLYCLSDFTVSLGLTQTQGSIVATMSQIGMIIGRPSAGFLSDRYGATTISTISYLFATLFALAMWIPTKNYSTALALGIFLGLFMGTVYPTSASIVARIVGIPKMNIAFSMQMVYWGFASIGGQLIGTALTSGVGAQQYQHTAIFAGCTFFASSVSMLMVRGYLIARDRIIDAQDEEVRSRYANEVITPVPLADAFRYCLTWPAKRA